jgi:hypothetical protein
LIAITEASDPECSAEVGMAIAPDEFHPATFFRSLKDASLRLRQAVMHSEERNLAIDEVFGLIQQSKERSRALQGSEKRAFIAKVELISGMKLENDTATPDPPRARPTTPEEFEFTMPDLSGRLERYVAPAKAGDPEMRVIQMAVKKQDGVTMILVIGEAKNAFYVTQGALGGEYRTWDTPHIGDARRQFSILREDGYKEVSPGELKHHRGTYSAPTTDSPNRRRLGRNTSTFARRKTDIAI